MTREKQIILEFDAKEMAAYRVGYLQALEEAARVAESYRISNKFRKPEAIAAAIRALHTREANHCP